MNKRSSALRFQKTDPRKMDSKLTGFLAEISKAEIMLWTEIHRSDSISAEVQKMYQKVCSDFQHIIFSDYTFDETQEAEYSFWKLHYRQIDGFRKKTKRFPSADDPPLMDSPRSSSSEQTADESLIDCFKSFLSQATDVYTNLITQIKRRWGISDPFSCSKATQKHQFLWYRFLICLGDLTRYKELCAKFAAITPSWSAAASYYLEATRVWSDAGHAQNQLAVLATYVGDEFLALYHSLRSLAVKNPFPDSWNNVILLFEKNRSSQFYPFSEVPPFDFSKPCEVAQSGLQISSESRFRDLLIRTLSFFFLSCNGEEFCRTFAAMLRELDALLCLQEVELNEELESSLFRKGPHCILQVICVLLFVMENQMSNGEVDHDLKCFAIASSYIVLGRLVERCSKEKKPELCPLLPAVLVFVERLPLILVRVDRFSSDFKVENAMIYFFDALVEFLSQITTIEDDDDSAGLALWEDFELRGFTSLSSTGHLIEYSSRQEHAENYKIGAQVRLHRIFNGVMKITHSGRKWVSYDAERKQFYSVLKDGGNGGSNDEEEIILFKPLTRFNSAPIDSISPTDESLKRAMSLLITQNQFPSTSQMEEPSSRPPPFKPFKNGGPPSLNAWVLEENHPSGLDEDLIIKEKDVSVGSLPQSPFPEPSAPLLPPDATWFDSKNSLFISPPATNYITWTYQPPPQPYPLPEPLKGYQSPRPLTSSEWLRHYRETTRWPPICSPLAPYSTYLPSHDTPKPGLLNPWSTSPRPSSLLYVGKHPLYGGDTRINERPPRQSPYILNPINIAEPFSPYISDRGWMLYQDPASRGPTYMGR